MSGSRLLRLVLVLVLVIWLGQEVGVGLLVDWLWFESLGFSQVFTSTLAWRAGLWASAFLLGVAFIGLNLRHAVRSAPLDLVHLDRVLAELRPGPRRLGSLIRLSLGAGVLFPSLFVAGLAQSAWQPLLLWSGRQDFGEVDPMFGLDLGFYLFGLPVLQAALALVRSLFAVTAFPVAVWFFVRDFVAAPAGFGVSEAARRHGLLLAAGLVLCSGASAWLDRYLSLSEQHGLVWGAGYADVAVRLPALFVLALLSLPVALGLLLARRRPGWTLPIGLLLGWTLLRAGATGVLPGMVQDWVVKPNELDLEAQYLARNIAGTRRAYALDRIEVQPFEARTDLSGAVLQANPLTVENIRIWDDRPLLTTYAQLQEIRLYYDFVDVDVDRYTIDGHLRQVMLSARELNTANLPAEAQSWVNRHLQFTHGYGLTMSPVNVVTPEGLPQLLVRDLPPVIDPALEAAGLRIDRPEIYHGELTGDHVFVRTGAQEFDYPMGDQNAYATYQGDGGVSIGSLWRKLLFALHFGSMDILLTQYLDEDSRVLFRRDIRERVTRLAPFLQIDDDPYLVIDQGRLLWVLDAYTTARRFPYSEASEGPHGERFNYIRNSVKAVVDAYDGKVRLYISDPEDPLVRAWARALPGVFLPLEEMAPSLRAHLRYPARFFDVQAAMYRAYHMTDPTVFYNKEDMWAVPRELYGGQDQAMEAYYLIMKLPGEATEELILLVPFVPTNRDNMISWLAARCDPEHYGKLVLFQFPKQKLIYGPRQIESRIDQDPTISQQITLWSQSGSRVVRGNLLVVPIADSLLYVEPLYLQAETSQLPELKRVIVAYDNRIAMEVDLDQALARIFGRPPEEGASAARSGGAGDGQTGGVGLAGEGGASSGEGWTELALRAEAELGQAIDAQKAGDWAEYGEALARLGRTIEALAGGARGGEAGLGAAPAEPVPPEAEGPTGEGASTPP